MAAGLPSVAAWAIRARGASPAIVDGVIYVRTNKHLCAFGE